MNAYRSHAKTGVLVDAAVFDLGGVLIDWNPRHLYRRLFGGDVAGMERFLADVCSPVWNARQDAGRSWDEAIAEAVAAHPEHADLISAFRERWAEMLGGALTDTVEILAELRDHQVPLFALTNWARDTFLIAQERYPFLQWFKQVIVEAASRVGLNALVYRDARQLRRELAGFGLPVCL